MVDYTSRVERSQLPDGLPVPGPGGSPRLPTILACRAVRHRLFQPFSHPPTWGARTPRLRTIASDFSAWVPLSVANHRAGTVDRDTADEDQPQLGCQANIISCDFGQCSTRDSAGGQTKIPTMYRKTQRASADPDNLHRVSRQYRSGFACGERKARVFVSALTRARSRQAALPRNLLVWQLRPILEKLERAGGIATMRVPVTKRSAACERALGELYGFCSLITAHLAEERIVDASGL